MARDGTKTGGGSRKGVPNKATQEAREAIAMFVDGNADKLENWLEQIAADNPKDAFNCFMSVVEYHIPKLQRTDNRFIDGEGNDRDLSVKVDYAPSKHNDT